MTWTVFLGAAGFLLLGYLSGSLTPSVWIVRLVKGVDVRDGGSGHATATNTIRQAGFGWGSLVLAADIGKGYFPTLLAHRFAPADWIVPLTAMAVVIGHCWPVFAHFRGGMGLASSGGCLLAVQPLAFLVGLGLLVTLVLLVRHSARQRLHRFVDGPPLLAVGLARSDFLDCAASRCGHCLPLPDGLESPLPRIVVRQGENRKRLKRNCRAG